MMRLLAALGLASILTGCAMGGGSFACKAPEGVNCSSVSGVYSNSIQNNLPSQKEAKGSRQEEETKESDRAGYILTVPESGQPIRSKPTVLRIWLAPWIDDDGDFRDSSFIYVQTDNGRWVLEDTLRGIKQKHAPVNPKKGMANAQ